MLYNSNRARLDARRNEQRILLLLRSHPTGQISYDRIAAAIQIDRRTVISVVRFLATRGQVRVVPGRGRVPNCYTVVRRKARLPCSEV